MPEQNVQALLSGYSWQSSSVSYSFPNSRFDYTYYDERVEEMSSLSPMGQQAVRFALDGLGSASPIGSSYMLLTSVASFTNLNLYFSGYDNSIISVASSSAMNGSSFGGVPDGAVDDGDVWMASDIDDNDFNVGRWGYKTILHELGHALGLKHGHSPDFGQNFVLSPDRDSHEFSVMTYHTHIGDTEDSYTAADSPTTFMMYDIAALQYLYGADFTTNSTDSVYSWDPSNGDTYLNGELRGKVSNGKILMTIWDGGGTDTYDLSNYGTTDLNLDLAPGGWSVFKQSQLAYLDNLFLGDAVRARANVFNALQYNGDMRSLIENATGAAGNDTIRGNFASNVLRGNAGNDWLEGLWGNDHLIGGTGDDTLSGGSGVDTFDGGAGSDTVDFSDFVDVSVDVDLADPSYNVDTFISIENLIGGALNDYLFGNEVANSFKGGKGNDYLYGWGGNDTLTGGAGADVISGGAGNDTADYSDSGEAVTINLATKSLAGGYAQGDRLYAIENLFGGWGNDWLSGDAGANILNGHFGNDILIGGTGGDMLYGGEGNDTLTVNDGFAHLVGGGGRDTFSFARLYPSDPVVATGYIWDFEIGTPGASDTIKIQGAFADYQDLYYSAVQSGNDIVIEKDDLTIVIKDRMQYMLRPDHFVFI